MKRKIRQEHLFIVLLFTISIGVFLISPSAATMPTSLSDSSYGYAPTVVIDPGHGGEDGGAVSISGIHESEINLDVASKLELILSFYGTPVVMTRTEQTLKYSENARTIREKKVEDQKRRLNIISGTKQAVLISIHQNNFPDGAPFGAQVLFAPTDGSKAFGEAMQVLLVDALNPKNRRMADQISGSIFLLNNITCPGILIECGFLSNSAEEKLLQTDTYRLKLAAVIAAGYLNNMDSLSALINGGTYESENSVFLYRLRY